MSKIYMVFGATSGIGEACLHQLCKDNCIVYAVGRNVDKLKSLEKLYSGLVKPIEYDLHDLENIKKIFLKCHEDGVKLDGFVYSAGIDGMWPLKVNITSRMREIMEINCFAFVEIARHFYSKKNSNDGASIVAVSSISSLTHEKGMSSYNASKAALNSFVKTMAKEFVSRSIRVNAVLPAGVETPMAENKNELYAGLKETTEEKIRRIPRETVASKIIFLLSDEATGITGEWITMTVDDNNA